MKLFNENADLSPTVATSADVVHVIRDELLLAYGMGVVVGTCPGGQITGTWNQRPDATLFDQPHMDACLQAAFGNVRDWARDMKIMYNKGSMEDCATQALSFAFECGVKGAIDSLVTEFNSTL